MSPAPSRTRPVLTGNGTMRAPHAAVGLANLASQICRMKSNHFRALFLTVESYEDWFTRTRFTTGRERTEETGEEKGGQRERQPGRWTEGETE